MGIPCLGITSFFFFKWNLKKTPNGQDKKLTNIAGSYVSVEFLVCVESDSDRIFTKKK